MLEMKKCRVCGKMFVPAPEHAYRVRTRSKGGNSSTALLCSYSCMRKVEKEHEAKYHNTYRAGFTAENEDDKFTQGKRKTLTLGGETKYVTEWAKLLHVNHKTVYMWMRTKGNDYAVQRLAEAKARLA